MLYVYDIEIMRHADIDKEIKNNLEQIEYYLEHKGRCGIRFKYHEDLSRFEDRILEILGNNRIFTMHSRDILTIVSKL